LARVGRREQSNTDETAILLHAMGALDGLLACRRAGPACDYISQGIRLSSRLRSMAQERYQQQHRGYVLQESHDVSTNQTGLS